MTNESPIPSNIHAEQTVLGAMLVEPGAVLDARGALDVADFHLDSHRRIFAALIGISSADRAVDLVTVREELLRRKELDAVGGTTYLMSLSEGLPRRLSIENYIRILRDKTILRELQTFSYALNGTVEDGSQEGMEIATSAIAQLSGIVERNDGKESVANAVDMAKEAEDRLIDNPRDAEVIPTGIAALDEMTGGGIRRGELWVIGASPSRGKTTLARQIVKNCIWRDVGCYVHSGEMTKESWFDVTACLLEGMPAWKVREPKSMNLTEKERLRNGLRELAQMPLYISDTGGIHLDKLIWNATISILQHKTLLNVVDYAQIINAPGKDRTDRVSAVAHKLRQFSKDTNTCTILLSQSARPEGRNLNAKPTIFSLKESGSLEEAAHVVILPYRPVDPDSNAFTGDDELIVGKSRWGAIGSIPVHLNGQYLRFDAR